ncbi:hypothetical protein GGF39_002803 [Coemansia sp. RSA 1721]|nr:hypothetical protein GGF39_002803 [Coemansia sp. RSA 1721]
MADETDCAELVPINELLKQTTLSELPSNSSFEKQARDSLLIRSQSYFEHRHAAVLDMKFIDHEPLETHINLNQISPVEENGIPAKQVTFRLPPEDDESGVLPNVYSDDDDAGFMPYLLPVYPPGLSVHNILRAGNEYNVLGRKKRQFGAVF